MHPAFSAVVATLAPLVEGKILLGWMNPLHYLSQPSLLLEEPWALVAIGFWAWMLLHCIRHDPERNMWLWVLLFLNLPGALIYFVVRWLPGARVSQPSLFNRWARARQIPRLEAAVRHIGNPHQHIELGDALRDLGRHERAAQCYQQALQKEPTNLAALWGAALAALQMKKFEAAKSSLQTILGIDGAYKFGDASLAYGRALCALGERDPARDHLKQHLQRWPHPEAHVLMATLLVEQGETTIARDHLEGMLLDIHASPAYYARQNRAWVRKAKQLLKRLPPAS